MNNVRCLDGHCASVRLAIVVVEVKVVARVGRGMHCAGDGVCRVYGHVAAHGGRVVELVLIAHVVARVVASDLTESHMWLLLLLMLRVVVVVEVGRE